MMKKVLILAAGLLMAALSWAQDFALSTNVLDYANLGTLNVEASYGLGTHWSVAAGVKYNPYTSRQQSYALKARWWPWHTYSGWWLSGNVRYQEYNTGGYSLLVRLEGETTEGDRYGGGLSGGYSYMISKHLNLDMGVGFWAGYDRFKTYACPRCGRVVGSGSRYFLSPSDVILGISYLF